VVNIHLICARVALRCRSQAAISASKVMAVFDAAIEALAAQNADLDFDHVEPGSVFWGVVEFQTSQDAVGLGRRESLIEGTR